MKQVSTARIQNYKYNKVQPHIHSAPTRVTPRNVTTKTALKTERSSELFRSSVRSLHELREGFVKTSQRSVPAYKVDYRPVETFRQWSTRTFVLMSRNQFSSPFIQVRTAQNQKRKRPTQVVEKEYEQEAHTMPAASRAQQVDYAEKLSVGEFEGEGSLQAYLKKVSWGTARGLAVSAAVAGATITLMPGLIAPSVITWTMVGGAVTGIASALAISFSNPTYHQTRDGGVVAIDSPLRKAASYLLFASVGLTLAPLLIMAHAVDPMIIPIALTATSAATAGMISFAIRRPRGSLLHWGGALYIALWGLIATSLLAAFTGIGALHVIECVAGIGIFAAMTAYDTQAAIERYHDGEPDHTAASTGFFLNIINMFMRITELLIHFMRGGSD